MNSTITQGSNLRKSPYNAFFIEETKEKTRGSSLQTSKHLAEDECTYHYIAPLVESHRQVSVGLYPLGIGRIHDCGDKNAG